MSRRAGASDHIREDGLSPCYSTLYTLTIYDRCRVWLCWREITWLPVRGRWQPAGVEHEAQATVEMHAPSVHGQAVEVAREQPVILDSSDCLSPMCAWRERNWVNIKALVAATEGGYRFVGLTFSTNVEPFPAAAGPGV
jgi:hypothetical protein